MTHDWEWREKAVIDLILYCNGQMAEVQNILYSKLHAITF